MAGPGLGERLLGRARARATSPACHLSTPTRCCRSRWRPASRACGRGGRRRASVTSSCSKRIRGPAAVAEPAAGQLGLDVLDRDRQPRGQALDDDDEGRARGTRRRSGSGAQHRIYRGADPPTCGIPRSGSVPPGGTEEGGIRMTRWRRALGVLLVGSAVLVGCGGGDGGERPPRRPPSTAGPPRAAAAARSGGRREPSPRPTAPPPTAAWLTSTGAPPRRWPTSPPVFERSWPPSRATPRRPRRR